jgi:hypothetical protein
MSGSDEEIGNLVTSDMLHNKNCFNYLRKLKISDDLVKFFPKELEQDLLKLIEIQHQRLDEYDSNFPYGDLYKRFFESLDDKTVIDQLNTQINDIKLELMRAEELEKSLSQNDNLSENMQTVAKGLLRKTTDGIKLLKKKLSTIEEGHEDLFISMYANNNEILEETYKLIKDITLEHRPVSAGLKSSIKRLAKDKGESINKESLTPSQAESTRYRLGAVFSDNYKPQHTTSLATERHYNWSEQSTVRELRFGTQGQRNEGIVQVSPAFEQFLSIQAKRTQRLEQLNEPRITHIYFNNLGRDRTDFEGKKERALTLKLEELEVTHPNVAVITLPADKGLIDHHDYQKTTPKHPFEDVKAEFLSIASQDPSCTQPIKDFYISERTRELLFKDKEGKYSIEYEKQKLGELIDKSFKALNIKPGAVLSPAEKQAVWFHFIKLELTNHIIDTFKPQELDKPFTINFSCKDAIDRGGVSSAYYNLINSFERSESPMSREEFERALHAAPTMVKGRGMNDHINIIWNTVNLYVNQKYESLQPDSTRAWLIKWRDLNCPKDRVEDVLNDRISDLELELVIAMENIVLKPDTPENKNMLVTIGLGQKILDSIKEQIQQGVSGKRLLLEAAVRTPEIILNPTKANITQYEQLTKNLSINYPALHVIGGLMKSLLGLVVCALSAGKYKGMLNEGWATVKVGWNVEERRTLQAQMKTQLENVKNEPSDEPKPKESPSPG